MIVSLSFFIFIISKKSAKYVDLIDLSVIIVKVDASRTLEDILMSNEKVARFNKQHYVVGLKETLKALNRDQVASLIIAQDVEVHLLARVFSLINHKNIPITYFQSKHALGSYVGINVNATIVALLNEN